MITAIDQPPAAPVAQEAVVNEEIWRAWVKKGRLQEQTEARKFKIVAGIVVVLLAIASAYYWVR
jgi:hypothetical protein